VRELKVSMDFLCCACEQTVSVTVRCRGKGLTAYSRTVAAVNVPCPTCGRVNQLYFEPSGTVRAVSSYSDPRPLLEPSVN
jgi:hypothetical protein